MMLVGVNQRVPAAGYDGEVLDSIVIEIPR